VTLARAGAIIETERLLLRPHRLSDFEGYAALWAGVPQSSRKGPLRDLDAEEAWARLLRFIGHWELFGYDPFVVFERSTATVIAEAGLADFHRGIGENFGSSPEAMWKVADGRQGDGVASEAMLSIMAWFDAQRPEDRTVCMIHETNMASRRVAERLGFKQFGHAVHRKTPVLLLERLKTKHDLSARGDARRERG